MLHLKYILNIFNTINNEFKYKTIVLFDLEC